MWKEISTFPSFSPILENTIDQITVTCDNRTKIPTIEKENKRKRIKEEEREKDKRNRIIYKIVSFNEF